MSLFPAFLKLEGRRCLVVGAGPIAQEKIEGLLAAGAIIDVVAPDATPHIRQLAHQRVVRWHCRRFRITDLKKKYIVVAATGSPQLHGRIFRSARRAGVLCNVVDDPPNCDFYYGAVVKRGALQIAISTEGKSPALAQRIRKILERQFSPEYEAWVEALGAAREKLFARPLNRQLRKKLLHLLASEAMFNEFIRDQEK